ncbi:hypothetical protein Q3G72_016805 [Acer saccharum]|nr:hypothetical protein Q3G72_016805 [Acer saccharum]
MDNNNYCHYEYESSHGYTQDMYIPPYGYTPTDGTSSFNPTPPFITNELPPTLEDTTPVQQNLSSARQKTTKESFKNWQSHKDEALCKAWLCVYEDDTAKWYNYVEGVKGRQHKGDTNNYPFNLNSKNSGANECMRSPHGCPSPSSVNLSDDGSPFSQSEGLERPP